MQTGGQPSQSSCAARFRPLPAFVKSSDRKVRSLFIVRPGSLIESLNLFMDKLRHFVSKRLNDMIIVALFTLAIFLIGEFINGLVFAECCARP